MFQFGFSSLIDYTLLIASRSKLWSLEDLCYEGNEEIKESLCMLRLNDPRNDAVRGEVKATYSTCYICMWQWQWLLPKNNILYLNFWTFVMWLTWSEIPDPIIINFGIHIHMRIPRSSFAFACYASHEWGAHQWHSQIRPIWCIWFLIICAMPVGLKAGMGYPNIS